MKLTCAQMIEHIKSLQPPEENSKYEDFLLSLIQRSINVETLPDYLCGITNISSYAFYECSELALTTLPDGVTRIGDYAFFRCYKLALTALPDGVTYIGGNAFNNCNVLAFSSLPASVTRIGSLAFAYCRFTSLTFKGTPTSIASDAFEYSDIKTINVPWPEGEVAGAPWGATNATINYNYTGE